MLPILGFRIGNNGQHSSIRDPGIAIASVPITPASQTVLDLATPKGLTLVLVVYQDGLPVAPIFLTHDGTDCMSTVSFQFSHGCICLII